MVSINFLHIALELWGALFCLIAVITLYIGRNTSPTRNNTLIHMEFITFVFMLMDVVAWVYRGRPGHVASIFMHISNFCVYFLEMVLILLVHLFIRQRVFGNEKSKCVIRDCAVKVMCVTGMILVVVSQFSNLYYYIDADNCYHRAYAYQLQYFIAFASLFLDISIVVQFRKRLSRGIFMALLSYIVLPVIAAAVQMKYYGISFINIATNISMLFLYETTVVEQSKVLREKERELYNLRIEGLSSQISAHFIYNVLTSIKYLCKTDSEKAADALSNFTVYLRGNLDSIKKNKMVMLEDELEHVRCYIELEKMRFPDRINVIYNLEEKLFLLPALTLQPIVENAIKHGITPKIEGGNIEVCTTKDDEGYIITVRDDGVGLGKVKSENSSDKTAARGHMGIENVRGRLKYMCNGSIDVSESASGGVLVTIRIPFY